MKRLILIGIILMLVLAGVAGCLGIGGLNSSSAACAESTTAITEPVDDTATSLSPSDSADRSSGEGDWFANLTVNGGAMNQGQADIAAQIVNIVATRTDIDDTVKDRAMIIALITGIVESSLQNLAYGDRDSLGVFQQRPSQGWGTPEQITDVNYATNKFLDVMLTVPDWQTADYGAVAQAVQRSAYPDRYDEHLAEAQAILLALKFVGGTSTTGSLCDNQQATQSRIEIAITAALSKVGNPYTWATPKNGPYDSASFLSWAFSQAGVTLPDTIGKLAQYQGSTDEGVQASFIPASDLTPQRGDMLLWSNNVAATDPSAASQAGLYLGQGGSTFSVASYNIKVGAGYPQRYARAMQIMQSNNLDIVGFQEIESADMYRDLSSKAFLGDHYAIYPSSDDDVYADGLQSMAIVYNSDRFEIVGQPDEIAFTRMQGERRQPAHAPVIHLRDKQTGQEIIVINTHNPAFRRFAKERVDADKLYVAKIQALQAEGLPIVFTGDMNEGYWVKPGAINSTYQNDRTNLGYCQLTADGLMNDAKDLADNITKGGEYCPRVASDGGWSIDHIYVSPSTTVNYVKVIDNTLSDHAALIANVTVPPSAGSINAGDDGDPKYVGAKPDDGTIAVLPYHSGKLLGAIRLTLAPTISVSGDWTLPVKPPYTLTAGFGDVSSLWATFHTGQDFADPTGTPIYAATSGTIIFEGWDPSYGELTKEKLSDGSTIYYGHQSAFRAPLGPVTAGENIGLIGATGNVTGPHLHFEIRTPDGTPVDPMPILRAHGLNP